MGRNQVRKLEEIHEETETSLDQQSEQQQEQQQLQLPLPEVMRKEMRPNHLSDHLSERLTELKQTFPFADVHHSTPTRKRRKSGVVESPEISVIQDVTPDDPFMDKTLMVISTEIVPPPFSDEEELAEQVSMLQAREEDEEN